MKIGIIAIILQYICFTVATILMTFLGLSFTNIDRRNHPILKLADGKRFRFFIISIFFFLIATFLNCHKDIINESANYNKQSRPYLDVFIDTPKIVNDPDQKGWWIVSYIRVVNKSDVKIRLLNESILERDFSEIPSNSKKIYSELQKMGYIDKDGNQTEIFYNLKDRAQDFVLPEKYKDKADTIFGIMNYKFNKFLCVTGQEPFRDYLREYRRDKLFYERGESLIPGETIGIPVTVLTGYPTRLFSVLCKIKYINDDKKYSSASQIVCQQIYELHIEKNIVTLRTLLNKKLREGDKDISKYFSGIKMPYLSDYLNQEN